MKVFNKWRDMWDSLEKTEHYCPNCGKQDVYQELGEGDYYTGPGHYCIACKASFSLPQIGVDTDTKFKE